MERYKGRKLLEIRRKARCSIVVVCAFEPKHIKRLPKLPKLFPLRDVTIKLSTNFLLLVPPVFMTATLFRVLLWLATQ